MKKEEKWAFSCSNLNSLVRDEAQVVGCKRRCEEPVVPGHLSPQPAHRVVPHLSGDKWHSLILYPNLSFEKETVLSYSPLDGSSPRRRCCWRGTQGQEHKGADPPGIKITLPKNMKFFLNGIKFYYRDDQAIPGRGQPPGEMRWLCQGCVPTRQPSHKDVDMTHNWEWNQPQRLLWNFIRHEPTLPAARLLNHS